MSDFEDGLKLQRGPGTKARPASASQAAAPNQLHPLTEEPEQEEEEEETAGASSNNNTIMGKMKKRLSILPAALSGWFSPSSKPDAAASPPQELLQRQPNGCTKRKRGRRRIVLAAEADAEADDVDDDGSAARGLNYEEVALADNITEHDLAAEDEQTRRGEYNVFLLRRQRDALAAAGGEEDDVLEDDVEDDEEEEECEEEDDDELHEQVAKRQRLKLETTVSLPQTRRMPLGSSTPAASLVPASAAVAGARSNSTQLAPHRRTHLNLYQNQRNREPAFNFFAGNETAAEGTTGDLPHSIRRSLNIPLGSLAGSSTGSVPSRNNSSLSLSSLPNYKRPSLLGKRDRNIIECTGDRQRDLIIINNNNNVEVKRGRQTDSAGTAGGGDSNSECDPVELNFHDNGEAHHNHNSHNNSRLEFYGNLQSTKSLFNRSSAQPTLHNSTWSLNSLSNRRTFNATIYGSTSALSDSRLLSHRGHSAASSASSSSSPFYQGPTAFGGNSANNRFFNRSASAASSLLAINSRGNMPVQLTGMKPTEMRSNNPAETTSSGGALSSSTGSGSDARNSVMSKTTHRILHLLDRYSTPLIDVKRMGSTLKEHQSSRRLRDNAPAGSPYSVPRHSTGIAGSLQSPAAGSAEQPSNKLLLPTMQQLLERRCLSRVTTNTRNLIQTQKQSVCPAPEDSDVVEKAATKRVPSSDRAATAATGADQPPSHSHRTNKMRSKLSHQTGRSTKESREEEAAPPPPDLPQISFPDMASTPKFDLVINKTPLHKPVVPTSPANKSDSNRSTSTKPNFLVNPQPVNAVSFAANGSATAAKSVYTFAKPTPLMSNASGNFVFELSDIERVFDFAAPSPLDADSEPVKEPQHPAINGLPSQGFGEQFKKSAKEWECDACMVRNKAEAAKCVACETAKPGASKAAPAATLFEQFKKSSKEWDCEVCMVRNKVEAAKCVACETPKPGAANKPASLAAPSPLAPIVPIGAGFGDRFKKSSGAWECEACMVTNKEEASKCIACETPRREAIATKTNNFSIASAPGVGFGDAFKLKTGQWECQTCMVMNDSSAMECVACQSANPRNGSSSNSEPSSSSSSSSSASSAASAPASPHAAPAVAAANSVSSSTSFKFGFTPSAISAPKPDAGFKQLVASQKAASWNCDACLAQNDMSRNKCLCCEQLKPGSSPTSTTAGNSSGSTVPGGASSVPKFSFGFKHLQQAKSGFTKEEANATKATSSTEETDAAAPASAPAPAPAATPQFVFRAPTTSSSASSSTATTTTTTSTPALADFSFGAPASSSSTVSSSSASSMPAAKPMFSLSGAGAASAVSSTSSQQAAPKTETLSFGATNTITTPSSTGFSLKPPAASATPVLSFAAPPASTSAPAPAPTPAPAAAAVATPGFSFGTQPKTVSTPAAAGTFFFGQPPAATPAAPAVNAGVSSIFGSSAAATNTSTAAISVSTNSTVVSSAVSVPPSNPLLFSFGAANKPAEETSAAKPFVFGSGGLGAATTTTMSSFGWPSNGATGMNSSSSSNVVTSTAVVSSSQGIMMAQPIFANSSSPMFGAPSSIASSSNSLFGSTATTAAATPAAVNLGGGFAAFGNVGNSLVTPIATAAATPATAAAPSLNNMFGNPAAIAAPAASSTVFGSATGGFGQGAAAVTAPAVAQGGTTKPAFNFSGAAAATATSSGAPFNFGSNTAAAAKPMFNFTGSATASTPQAGAFTFTANPTAAPLTTGDAAQSTTQRIFRFGASSAAADIGGAVAGPEGAASSTAFGGVPPMFNFNAATPQTQMQSTPNANAPFQFSGAPAPANIFAFNQPAGQSAQNSQMVRRKVRTPMRRLPPR